jgi:hypothetical protein
MPVQVNEIIIKATIESEKGAKGGGGGNAASGNNEALITECVEQVLQILKSRNER